MSKQINYMLKISEYDSSFGDSLRLIFPLQDESNPEYAYTARIDLSIPDSTSDEVISIGEITTVKAVILVSDQTLTLEIGGNDVTITAGRPLFWLCSSFTSLKVSNASGETATLQGYLWGD